VDGIHNLIKDLSVGRIVRKFFTAHQHIIGYLVPKID